VAVRGRDRDQLLGAESVELGAAGEASRRVELVDDEQHASTAAAELGGRGFVRGRKPGLAVEHVDDERGAFDGAEADVVDGAVEAHATHTGAVRVLAVTLEAAGVDEEHGAIVEDGDGLVDVARHPRRRVDDGLLPTQEAIEERRLAGIRAAGEHDTRQRLRGGTAGLMSSTAARAVRAAARSSRPVSRLGRAAPAKPRRLPVPDRDRSVRREASARALRMGRGVRGGAAVRVSRGGRGRPGSLPGAVVRGAVDRVDAGRVDLAARRYVAHRAI
jgi:hypothetical protein